jgi:hypothetical protein
MVVARSLHLFRTLDFLLCSRGVLSCCLVVAKVKGARPVRVSKVEGSWTWVFFKCPAAGTFVIPMNNALSYYSYPAEINFSIKSLMTPSTKYNPDPQQSNLIRRSQNDPGVVPGVFHRHVLDDAPQPLSPKRPQKAARSPYPLRI